MAGNSPVQAKVIYNLIAGREDLSPAHLAEVLTTLQDAGVIPEVYMVNQKYSGGRGRRRCLAAGHSPLLCLRRRWNSYDRTVPALVNTPAILAVVPTGTQNNAALTFGIPLDSVPKAISILKQGKVVPVDTGLAAGPDT